MNTALRVVTEVPRLAGRGLGLGVELWRAVSNVPTAVGLAVQTGASVLRDVEVLLADLQRSARRTHQLLDELERLPRKVSVVIGQAELLFGSAASVEETLAGLVADLTPVLQALTQIDPEVLGRLSPFLEDASWLLGEARTLEPTLLADVTATLTRLPGVLMRIDEQVLPSVHSLEGLVPVVAQLAVYVDHLNGVVADVGSLLSGIPGSARLLRRGERDARPVRPGQAEDPSR